MTVAPDETGSFSTALQVDASAEATHPPVEEMSADERAHLGIGDPQ